MKTINNKAQFWAISSEGMQRMATSSVPPQAEAIASANMAASGDNKAQFLRDVFSIYFNQRKPMSITDGIAEVHMYGPMMADASPIDLAMGGTSYEEIRADIQAANDDESVNAILLVTDTPGGTVSGIEETYIEIKNSEKPVFGYNEGSATSAGYYLIAAAESIAVSQSSVTGNIGTVLDYWDLSEMYSQMGAERVVMTNEGADLKGTMRGPLTEDQAVFLQNQINSMGEQFHERVKENRTDLDDEVYRAGWYGPKEAAALGLVDYVGSKSEYREMIKSAVDIRKP